MALLRRARELPGLPFRALSQALRDQPLAPPTPSQGSVCAAEPQPQQSGPFPRQPPTHPNHSWPATWPHQVSAPPLAHLASWGQHSSSTRSWSADASSAKETGAQGGQPPSQQGQPGEAPHEAQAKGKGTEEQDPAQAVLAASLPYVLESGWTEAAMLEGAREAGLSPAILALFPRREAHLVEYFMDECRRKFEEESRERASELVAMEDLAQRLQLVVRMRLEQQALYTSTWAQALSIQALPTNLMKTTQQRMQLVASLWSAAGEKTRSDLEARAVCGILSAVYTAAELYMLADFSPGYEDTWQFTNRRTTEALKALEGVAVTQDQILKTAASMLKQMGLAVPFAGAGGAAAQPSSDQHHHPPGPHSYRRPPDTWAEASSQAAEGASHPATWADAGSQAAEAASPGISGEGGNGSQAQTPESPEKQ